VLRGVKKITTLHSGIDSTIAVTLIKRISKYLCSNFDISPRKFADHFFLVKKYKTTIYFGARRTIAVTPIN
jgi:hypothetical protein